MARATTKAELVKGANEQFEKLWTLIDGMTEEQRTAAFAFEDRDKNLRDVLVHLYEWHQMMARWHQVGTIERGAPEVPGRGYNWRTLSGLNAEIWAEYQHVPLSDAVSMLKGSHEMIMALIDSHSDDELFGKGVYPWTKTTTLGAYFVSNTASHYDWAMKKLRKHARGDGA